MSLVPQPWLLQLAISRTGGLAAFEEKSFLIFGVRKKSWADRKFLEGCTKNSEKYFNYNAFHISPHLTDL